MNRLKGLFVLEKSTFPLIYGPQEQQKISELIDLIGPVQSAESIAHERHLLRDIDVLLSGWGSAVIDEAFLGAAPNLKAIFYGGGSTGYFITEGLWKRGIVISSAYAANSIPVAEYTLAVIIFSLKHGWSLMRRTHMSRAFPDRNGAPGCYGTTVGLISLGVTARKLAELLSALNVKVIAYDPFVSAGDAAELGVELVALEELFQRSDAVSVHTPLLPETIGMITAAHIDSMKHGATFINTARGPVVRENEMIQVLMRRPDLQAVLDVANEEPPPSDSPLFTLQNVVLTPHIAGSVGMECRRMGESVVEELKRYIAGEPLKWVVTPELTQRTIHHPAPHVRLPRPEVLKPVTMSPAART
jgi:phosphoglycerate dehydrogenase-like enzyme